MRFINFILDWTWQLLQSLAGLILVKSLGAVNGITWWLFERKGWFSRFISGVSLGKFIILASEDLITIQHEYGHSIQSKYLGLLYLPIVGIYSAVFCNLWYRTFHRLWTYYDRVYWYYKIRWTERWADTLGGVDRDTWLKRSHRPSNARYPAV